MFGHVVSFHVERERFTCFATSNCAENKKEKIILHCNSQIQADYDASRLHQTVFCLD